MEQTKRAGEEAQEEPEEEQDAELQEQLFEGPQACVRIFAPSSHTYCSCVARRGHKSHKSHKSHSPCSRRSHRRGVLRRLRGLRRLEAWMLLDNPSVEGVVLAVGLPRMLTKDALCKTA